MAKAPEVGDRIVHHEPGFDRTNEGVVEQLLSMQFTYRTDNDLTRFCLYKEDWRKVNG
jgi:hypothetical protein